MVRVFVSNYPFCRDDITPLEILKKEGFQVEINPLGRKMKPDEVAESAFSFDAIIAGTEDLTYLVNKTNTIKIIYRIGIGLDSVPLKLCREKKIQVSYTPDAVTPAVTEFTIGLMISALRKIPLADREIRQNKWVRHYGKRIGKCKVGIIGFGRVGYGVAKLLRSFEPEEILVNDIINIKDKIESLQSQGINIKEASKEEIFMNSDIITLHVPLTEKTKNLVSKESLSIIKKNSVLINTSRSEIVSENEIFTFLKNNPEFVFSQDVFEPEPYSGKLKELENMILTQHMGSCAFDSRARMEFEAAEDVIHFFKEGRVKRPALDE
jgi:D-3-phosphoglycerate dehydrogenase